MSMESNILGEKGKNGITDCHNFEMAEDGHLYSPPAPADGNEPALLYLLMHYFEIPSSIDYAEEPLS
ncbi:hypothetical protein TIFTF001_018795 [Ficus carica]|uniref:Uncharacterized protein n=1 Tax=Ficus carica TaxID=3494 RepID=A0AA88DJA3_FICCA|nr:hypothetical protein TIFTF001_018795 [Ficus carica]